MSDTERLFAVEYLIDRNGRRAYNASHPRCRSDNTAAVEASRLLRKPKVAAFIEQETKARLTRLQMDGDEALAAISRVARVDIRRLFDAKGELLPVHLWPDDVASSVKSIRRRPGGVVDVVLHDALKARELMAIAGGKLKQSKEHKVTFDHAAYLAAEPPPGDE